MDADGDGDFGGGDDDEGGGGGDGGDDPFYSAVVAAAAKKKQRRSASGEAQATATAEFLKSRPDEDALHDPAGHRKASRTILQNRGLVKYRNREDKNPRVAYRKKAAKQEKRRSGAVVRMREGGEGVAYGGEATGIRTNISRARILK